MVDRNCNAYPYNSQYAYSHAGKQHGNPAVPNTSQGAGINLDQDIGDKGWNHKMQDIHSAVDHGPICGKQMEDIFPEKVKEQREDNGSDQGHEQADLDSFLYPFWFICSIVLSHKGGDGNTKSTHNHPEDTVNLGISGIGSDRNGSQSIDAGLDNDIGSIIHDRLQSRRETDLYDLFYQKAFDL